MKTWKLIMMVITVILMMDYASLTFAAVSPEEAKKLGTTLTMFGAERAGNKDGTIPVYTGGLTTPPANFKPGSGVRPDPFAGEKPLFSISAQNMSRYADKLTEGTKALMKKYPTFRIDVYKTHRTVAYPDFVLKNTAKNAVMATTAQGGISLRGAHGGLPFPIPKDGYEVMWNHLVRYQGRSTETKFSGYVVDSSGRRYKTQEILIWEEYPYYDEDLTRGDSHLFWKMRGLFTGPPRKAGEIQMLLDPLNMAEESRIAYMYLPGQRRVKLAPEIAFDTMDGNSAGNNTYDEGWCLNGSMERYNWKLLGKKEFYVPYNDYKATYQVEANELHGPNHLNPDVVRWELHRMWIVEADLRPNKRHIYHKRRIYVDEDSWTAAACENYDALGNLYKVNYDAQAPCYDIPAPNAQFFISYNMIANRYITYWWPGEGGYIRPAEVRPLRAWTGASLAGGGVR
jgi:hypothetical protein